MEAVRIIHNATCVDGARCQLAQVCSYWRDATRALRALVDAGFNVTRQDTRRNGL